MNAAKDNNQRINRVQEWVIVKKSSPKNLSVNCRPTHYRQFTDRLPTANRQATDSFPKKKIVEKTRIKHDIVKINNEIQYSPNSSNSQIKTKVNDRQWIKKNTYKYPFKTWLSDKFERDWDIVYLSNMAERKFEAAIA